MILIKSWVIPKDQKFESDWENVQIEKQRRLGFDGKIKHTWLVSSIDAIAESVVETIPGEGLGSVPAWD